MTDRFKLYAAPIAQAQLADAQRGQFLQALHRAASAGVNVTDFEAKFIATYLEQLGRFIWTGPRRHVADEMMHKYRHQIPSRSTTATGTAKPAGGAPLPPAVRGKCSYLVRADAGPQQRCNQPADHRNAAGAEFCADHWQQRTEYLERRRQIKARRP